MNCRRVPPSTMLLQISFTYHATRSLAHEIHAEPPRLGNAAPLRHSVLDPCPLTHLSTKFLVNLTRRTVPTTHPTSAASS